MRFLLLLNRRKSNEKENKSVFPTIFSTERPDKVCQSLLNGRIVIMVDNSQFALLLPITLNDLFLSTEDGFNKLQDVLETAGELEKRVDYDILVTTKYL